MTAARDRSTALGELALLFLKLGATSFGGPAAHIAMMDAEIVRRRGWLTREQFLDYIGAANLIPGPTSTELAIHIGHARAGRAGLVVAGACFIAPAALIVLAVAWAYVNYRGLPEVAGVFYGIKPAVLAIVAQALWALARTAVRTYTLAVVGVIAVVAVAAGVHELLVLALAAAAMVAVPGRRGTLARIAMAVAAPGGLTLAASTAAASAPITFVTLFLVFAKAGALLFGSGYVLLAFLRADLVERLHWLTEAQLLDAIAVGQVTPGPVFTTATFIGYVLAGPAGAAVATAGIFVPAFVFVALSGPLVPMIRRSPVAGRMLDGVNVASLALMTVVSWQLARAAIVDGWTLALAAASLLALVRFNLASTWLIAAGAAAGWFMGA